MCLIHRIIEFLLFSPILFWPLPDILPHLLLPNQRLLLLLNLLLILLHRLTPWNLVWKSPSISRGNWWTHHQNIPRKGRKNLQISEFMCYYAWIFFSNFNPTKCEVMRISHNKDKRSTRYNISGTELRNVSNYKDLGVFMASRTAKSVFEALASAKINASEIACLQCKMNGEVIITFKSILAKEKFLRLNSLQVDTEHFALQDVNKPLSFLTTYDAPFELSDLDIICLQKVHCSLVQECSSWFLSSRFGVVCSPGSVCSSGCAILFRPSLSLLGSWYDTEGHYLKCEFSFRDQGTHC